MSPTLTGGNNLRSVRGQSAVSQSVGVKLHTPAKMERRWRGRAEAGGGACSNREEGQLALRRALRTAACA